MSDYQLMPILFTMLAIIGSVAIVMLSMVLFTWFALGTEFVKNYVKLRGFGYSHSDCFAMSFEFAS